MSTTKTKLFTQNSKMKATSKEHGIALYNFGIPAFRSTNGFATCPNATKCVNGCYAQSGAYLWSNVAKAYEYRLEVTKSVVFEGMVNAEIADLERKNKFGRPIIIRVHDSGDFYSLEYMNRWFDIANKNPMVKFYAYTKMVSMVKNHREVPKNFTFIFSYGGREDSLIDPNVDRHSYVFDSTDKLERNGYVDASHDDSIAWSSTNHRIGLVYHGAKNFSNTNWGKVDSLTPHQKVA